jgi:hypothetical protein
VLDGNMHFNMVVDMVRFMNIRVEFCNELPDVLIVGVGYPVAGTLTEMLHKVMHGTLFHHSDLFQRCVAVSFDPVLDQEQAFAEINDSLPVRLHLVWEGISQQDLAGPRSLVDRLTTRHYDGLRMTHETMIGTHCAMVPFAYQSGLQQVFSR